MLLPSTLTFSLLIIIDNIYIIIIVRKITDENSDRKIDGESYEIDGYYNGGMGERGGKRGH